MLEFYKLLLLEVLTIFIQYSKLLYSVNDKSYSTPVLVFTRLYFTL